MAEAPKNIEDVAKNATPQNSEIKEEHAKEQKPKGTLESAVNETFHLAGNAVKIGAGIAIPTAFAYAVPSFRRDTAILAGAQVASDITTSYRRGKKYTAGNFLESTVLGTAMTPVLETMFRTVNRMPLNTPIDYVAKAGVWGGLMYPAFVASYQPIAYLIRNRTFKGMGKYIKENYWTALKDSWTKLLPFSLLNVFFAPSWLQIPISAALSYLFDLFGAPQKDKVPEHLKRDKTPYLVATSNVLGRLGKNTAKGFYDVFYGIGAGLRNLYDSAPKAAPASPATAAAHS